MSIRLESSEISEEIYADEYPYRNLCALLLLWDEDDGGASCQLGLLRRVLARNYNFDVEVYRIPSENPLRSITEKIDKYERRCSATESLLLVYYVGHSSVNKYGDFIMSAFNEYSNP